MRGSALLFVLALAAIPAWGRDASESSHDADVDSGVGNTRFQIEGKVYIPEPKKPKDWYWTTRILVDGGKTSAFIKEDDSFVISGLPHGSYLVEVVNPDHYYEPIRVDITSKGKVRARKVNNLQPNQVTQLPYPLRLKPVMKIRYFQQREEWKISDMLMNPMVLMMVLPLLLVTVLPKMLGDAETQKEMQELQRNMQQQQNQLPEVSELFANFFGSGEGNQDRNKRKALKSPRK